MFYKAKLLTILICLLPLASIAEEIEYVELQSRCTKMYRNFVVNEDSSVEEVAEIEIKVLTEKAALGFKEQSFSHSTSIEEFEVLEAYTIKADGTKIDVPKGNYQITVNKGNEDNTAIFSDHTKVTVVFPDLEKNDSTYIKIKNIETEPMFPKHFSTSKTFWSQKAYDDVKIVFDLPENMDFKYQVREMKEEAANRNGRKLLTLTYQLKKPVKIKRDDFSVLDESKEAGYAISTFKDYESVAKAYGERALPKAVPTERTQKLAKEITGDETDKREQARLLYDWVATNISYGGNCIGVGAVVPHDTDFVLDNRMGDCKDHATLINAFYDSVGIESTQALINSGSRYSLPEIPMVSSVNHVINYLPEWDMFVDSTNPSLPFDQLSFSLSDKPVLLVEDFKPGFKTPAMKVGDNYQKIESKMRVKSDGSVEGNMALKMIGFPAVEVRRSWRHTTKEQEEEWLESVFSSNNKKGFATMEKDDPTPLLSEFNYSFEFIKPEFILPKGIGSFYVGPLVGTPMSIYSYMNHSNEEIKGYDVACGNGYTVENLVYEFPETLKILAHPENFEIDENYLSFKATYELEGSKLKVVREMNDQTPGNVCSADLINLQRKTLIKVSESLQSQVVYQH